MDGDEKEGVGDNVIDHKRECRAAEGGMWSRWEEEGGKYEDVWK